MSTDKTSSIVLLHESLPADARQDELDALVQVDEVSAALDDLGWRVATLAVDLDIGAWLDELRAMRPTLVFNLVESLGGQGRLIPVVPAVLAANGIPFTGSDSDSIFLSSQKLMAKRWLAMHGVPTPAWREHGDQTECDNRQWIVKSVWEHASLGIDDESVVRGREALDELLERRSAVYGGEWFAEHFIDGREFNISIIEEAGMPRVLPVAEISFLNFPADKPKIVGYAAKWDTAAPEYIQTPRCFPDLPRNRLRTLVDVVSKCWKIFGLRGYARVDIRLDRRGVPWVLEINANPCLTQDAGFVAAAAEGNLSYERVIDAIVDATLRTGRLRHEALNQDP
jgi:D-alanine-D-alanine ligase